MTGDIYGNLYLVGSLKDQDDDNKIRILSRMSTRNPSAYDEILTFTSFTYQSQLYETI